MKIKWVLLILLVSVVPIKAQNIFTDEEVLNIANKISKLQTSDSLKTVVIKDLESLVFYLSEQAKLDSLLIHNQYMQINLLHEQERLYLKQLEIIRPKWYEHKYLYYIYGVGTIIISSLVVNNIK